MVVFVDLEQASPAAAAIPAPTPDLNPNHPFSAALVLYPFIAGLARHLDRTDLHNLASTCRHFHRTLTACRPTLLTLSLRCGWPEVLATAGKTPADGLARLINPIRMPCPRDLVQCCNRCTLPICRNCIRKTHPTHSFRLRRLCPPCQCDPTILPSSNLPTYESRTLYCTCPTSAWICPHCMMHVGAEDNTYRLLCWSWAEDSMLAVRMPARIRNSQGGGKICCARGRECSGVLAWGLHDEDEVGVEVAEEEAEWSESELANAFETTGDQRWEETAERLKIVRERGGKKGGRPVEWDGMGDTLVKEWHGDVRGWCNWCDKVALSREDMTRAGING